MSEAYIEVGKLLSEIKARVLNVPCPQCGGLQDEPVKAGGDTKCKYCGSFYGVESSLNTTTAEALENLVANVVNDALRKHGLAADVQLEKLTNLLQQYADQALKETRNFYGELGRLPLREDLDKRLSEGTQQILKMIASTSKRLLDEQEAVSFKVDSVMGRVESVRIDIKEIRKLLEGLPPTKTKRRRKNRALRHDEVEAEDYSPL